MNYPKSIRVVVDWAELGIEFARLPEFERSLFLRGLAQELALDTSPTLARHEMSYALSLLTDNERATITGAFAPQETT